MHVCTFCEYIHYLRTCVCTASFIPLIPKVRDPLFLKDYRPLNLIGNIYKVLSKLLALHLKKVVGNFVGLEKTSYIEGRNILDGSLMINELYTWVKKAKKSSDFQG